jgi:hypothetical protein
MDFKKAYDSLRREVLYNILTGFGIAMKMVRLIKMWRVQGNQEDLHGTYQFLVYADDVSILGRSTYTIKKNAEALVATSKQTGIEENADKTKYIVMS